MGGLAEIPDLAGALSRDLTEARVAHAISGAVAMAAHGYVRATRDVDILVVAPATRWPAVFDIVRQHGFEGEDPALILSLRERGVATLARGSILVEILVPVLPYHRRVLERAVFREQGGVRVPYVTPEDLVVLKMLWRRPKDVADVQVLIEAARESLDAGYVRTTLRAILPDDDPRHAEIDAYLKRFGGHGAIPAPP